MTKVSGTYVSLHRGVNQQPFEARLDGQHGAQVNMWSDPVHGLSRRRGTQQQSCVTSNATGPSYHELTEAWQDELRDFYASYRTVPYITGGVELQVHYPTKAQPSWMLPYPNGPQGGILVTRKVQSPAVNQPGAVSVSVDIGTAGHAEHTATLAAVSKGISAACQLGRYFLFAPNATPFVAPITVDAWSANEDIAIQIKQGVPNRTYSVTALVDGVDTTWTYTTPSSAYSGALDTSDILASDPEYQKKVNDRVNAYNSAVTQWITSSAGLTRPTYIAASLEIAMSGLSGVGCTVSGFLGSAGVYLRPTGGRVKSVTVSDGGDGSTVAVTERTVTSISKLTAAHTAGKIVQIKPERGEASFYVKAVPTSGVDGWRGVRWEECANTTAAPIVSPFIVMAVKEPVVGASPVVGLGLATISGLAYLAGTFVLNDPTADDLPAFNHRLVGDPDSSPAPGFLGKQITWMNTFQDRLCIAAGNTIDMSEVGNYFNFFRTQTLTVPDTDPVNIYALGSESDTIRHSVLFDRSLLLFGDSQQYSIDGRNPITPSTSTVTQSSAIEDAVDCPPVAGGSLVFFGKRREASTEVFQMEVGDVSDTSNFTGLGLQLSDYLPGRPTQLLYVASPSTLFVRCSDAPHSVFVFRFIDQNRQRLLDSWSRFDYHPAFGIILGMFYHEDALYYRVAREAWKDQEGTVWRGGQGYYGFDVLERQSMLPQVPGLPYLDSMRPAAYFNEVVSLSDWWGSNYPFLATAFTRDKIANRSPSDPKPPIGADWLHGQQPNTRSQAEWDAAFADLPTRDINYCVVGAPFESYVELTSPVRKDRNGAPIMQGRLTVGALSVYYKDSSGFSATVDSAYGSASSNHTARLLGSMANIVGAVPVTTGSANVFVGKETKDYVCKIAARGWLPLSVTRVTWTGQWFMNHRFV